MGMERAIAENLSLENSPVKSFAATKDNPNTGLFGDLSYEFLSAYEVMTS
jgi:hypothetical protein